MKRITIALLAFFAIFLVNKGTSLAKGAGTSAGLTLLEAPSARAAAVAEAFSAVPEDVSAFHYNPASLRTLNKGHASFMYQNGMADDTFGQFMIGLPRPKGSWGLSVGYYNGGEMDVYDGVTERTVTAEQDLTLALGYAREVGPVSLGFTGKYIQSELIEREKASAYAMDVGVSAPVLSRLRLAAAAQNFGTQMKYMDEGDDLPRIVRGGLALSLFPNGFNTSLLLDTVYYMNEEEMRPALGAETMVGPMAVRAGYKMGGDLNEFSVGAGFLVSRASFDYAFGMVEELDSQHRISLSMHFGDGSAAPALVKKDEKKKKRAVVKKKAQKKQPTTVRWKRSRPTLGNPNMSKKKSWKTKKTRRIYIIKRGDSLAKIAQRFYGRRDQWRRIYTANKHLIDSPRDIKVGQKLIIP